MANSKTTKSRSRWKCLDCKVDTGKISEYYMLIDETWNKIHFSERGMLCVDCVEIRLGRELNKSDFKKCYLNRLQCGTKSDKLVSRLTKDVLVV